MYLSFPPFQCVLIRQVPLYLQTKVSLPSVRRKVQTTTTHTHTQLVTQVERVLAQSGKFYSPDNKSMVSFSVVQFEN